MESGSRLLTADKLVEMVKMPIHGRKIIECDQRNENNIKKIRCPG